MSTITRREGGVLNRRAFLSAVPAVGTAAIFPAMAGPTETPIERACRLERELMETVAGILDEDATGWYCLVKNCEGGGGRIEAVLRFAHLPREERKAAHYAHNRRVMDELVREAKTELTRKMAVQTA